MSDHEQLFEGLLEKYSSEIPGVTIGKMMSAPALKYKNQVFAFYHKESMGFRLGPLFDPKSYGIINPQPLSPFKTKPPLKGWYIIDQYESNLWEPLTELALDFTQTLK